MVAWVLKYRISHWLGKLLVVFSLMSPWGAQAAVESVAPISGGTVWYTSWKAGSFPSAVAACSSLSPADCPVCGSLTYVGIQPNRAYPSYMDCVTSYNPGGGMPGWNTLSGTAIPWSNAVCPVPTVNPTVPYRYKVSSGMCEREVQCPAPNTINPATGQCEPPKALTVILEGGTTTEPSTLLPFNAVVKDQNGVVQPGKQIIITTNAQDSTGGHIHTENRPKGSFTCSSSLGASPATCTLTTDNSGQAPFEFVATPISGTHTITATCAGCSNTATKSVDVKVNGLIPIPGSSRYALTDSAGVVIGAVTNKHTANHYLTSAAIVKLEKLAKTYSKVNPGAKLYLNDASLTWGGLFDVGNTSWSSPHSVHDKGRSLDIRAANSGPNNEGAVPATVFREFIDEARLKKFNVGLHCKNSSDTNYCLGQPNNRHFHVDF